MELEVDGLDLYPGQRWLTLSESLEVVYSVMERLRLRDFRRGTKSGVMMRALGRHAAFDEH